ncbi:MAG: ABC transporter ATP-binding protein [Pirellulaceae bacterium]|nr:ABC transporter ATP-binding protein [Pirellulaceae bacterium]
MSAVANAVEVQQLGKTYRDGLFGRRAFKALTNVTLTVSQGEVFGLLGPNGAGKTTLLKILLGIIQKTSGSATMLGLPAGGRAVRSHVGYLPEHLRIPGHHTVLSALDLYGSLSNLSGREIRLRRDPIIEMVGLKGRDKEPIKKFSKGMLQRLGLAQALLVQPKLMILDEPTDGLDPRGRAEMRALITKMKVDGVTVFLNSHILQEVELVCDRVAILDRGHLKFCGSVKETGQVMRQSTFISLDVVVNGEPLAVKTACSGFDVQQSATLPDQQIEINFRLGDQEEIDRLVDQLRQHHISIVSLKRKQASLEEAFLAILGKSESN